MTEYVDPFKDIDPLKQKFPATEDTPGVTEEIKELLEVEPNLWPETIQLRKAMTRVQAIERGRALGEHEADSRQEVGEIKDERVARAMAYAAWEWDGKPASSASQREEFGITSDLTPSLERVMLGQVVKKEKKARK